MEVLSIRRYPVKSMGGEALSEVQVDPRGLRGDRWYAVRDDDDRLASGKDSRRFRRRDAVFDYAARTESDRVLVSGRSGAWWAESPDLDAELTETLGVTSRVRPEADVPHQDGGSVSLVGSATLDWCASRWGLDCDPRRLRVNLVIDTADPFVEESWVGRTVDVGECALRVVQRVERCRTVDVDQDGVRADGRLLRELGSERDLCLAVYADVVRPGRIRTGDPVRAV